jgi:hypothetical protein
MGYAFGLAQCDQPAGRWHLPVHAWDLGAAAAGFVVGLSALAVSARLFFATRGADDAPPQGRVHFLAVVGLVVDLLALGIIVLDGVGTPLTALCHQS